MSLEGRRVSVGLDISITEGVRRRVKTEDLDLIIIRMDGRLVAFDNHCPHQHFAALHEGSLDGYHLKCPMHGWTFDIRTGKSVTGDGCLRTRELTVEDGVILVSVV